MLRGINILINEYGTWQIERIVGSRGYRWNLWFWVESRKQWALVANQGRRKTCVELAEANYRGSYDG